MKEVTKLFEDFKAAFSKRNEDLFSVLSELITDMHKVLCDDEDTPEEVFVQRLEEFSVRMDELCYTVNSSFREAKLTERTAKRKAEINISNIRKYETLAKNAVQNGHKDSAQVFQAKREECIAQADTLQQEFTAAAYSALDIHDILKKLYAEAIFCNTLLSSRADIPRKEAEA